MNTMTRKIDYATKALKPELSPLPQKGRWRPSKKQGKRLIKLKRKN